MLCVPSECKVTGNLYIQMYISTAAQFAQAARSIYASE